MTRQRGMIFVSRSATALACLLAFAPLCPSATPPSAPAGWASYSSSDYAFTIQYPKDFTNCAGGLAFCTIPSAAEGADCDETAVDCLVLTDAEYQGTNFEQAGLSINVLRQNRTEQACNTFAAGSGPISTKTINGVPFQFAHWNEGAMGHFYDNSSYRALYDGVCFELSILIGETNFGDYAPGTIKKFDETSLAKNFDAIVATIKFAGAVVDGPAWQMYENTIDGGSFEYPDGDTVVKTIDDSQNKNSPSAISDSVYFADHGLDYTVSAKLSLPDTAALDAWLKSAGYPDLSAAQELRHSSTHAEYKAANYWYFFGDNTLYILSASDQQHKIVAPPNGAVLRHFVSSFNPN